jgi:hypothetical protein
LKLERALALIGHGGGRELLGDRRNVMLMFRHIAKTIAAFQLEEGFKVPDFGDLGEGGA